MSSFDFDPRPSEKAKASDFDLDPIEPGDARMNDSNRVPVPPRDRLKPVMYEGVEIDVDPNTGGVWLDGGELKKIVDLREKLFNDQEKQDVAEAAETSIKGVPEDEIAHERLSPVTGKPMKPVNYGGDTGVIIDVCEDTGGIWLDPDELEKIQMVIENWETKLGADMKKHDKRLRKIQADVDEKLDVKISQLPFVGGVINSVVNGILDFGHLRK
jgi:Zn-finger nucleic acid-binding protein